MMITFRLSEEFDQELINEVQKIPKKRRSKTYREALRLFFFGQFKESSIVSESKSLKIQLDEDDLKDENIDLDSNLDDSLSMF